MERYILPLVYQDYMIVVYFSPSWRSCALWLTYQRRWEGDI